jgi:RNA polymerase sigma factor (sigma-70 family)
MSHSNKRPSRISARAKRAVEQYRVELHRFLTRRLHSSQDAGDLAQDVYLRFLQLPDTDLIRQPQAYLYRIASNLVYEYRLREKRRDVVCDPAVLEELAEDTADSWIPTLDERLSTGQQLERVLQQLPETYRAILLLQKRDGLSYAEIAKRLGLSVHTVQKYLFRALAHCRAADWDR